MTDMYFDPELSEILGSRIIDETSIAEEGSHIIRRAENKIYSPWKHTIPEQIKICARTLAPLAIAQAVVFTWQYCGALDNAYAFPTLWVMAILTGICVGKYIK